LERGDAQAWQGHLPTLRRRVLRNRPGFSETRADGQGCKGSTVQSASARLPVAACLAFLDEGCAVLRIKATHRRLVIDGTLLQAIGHGQHPGTLATSNNPAAPTVVLTTSRCVVVQARPMFTWRTSFTSTKDALRFWPKLCTLSRTPSGRLHVEDILRTAATDRFEIDAPYRVRRSLRLGNFSCRSEGVRSPGQSADEVEASGICNADRSEIGAPAPARP